MTPLPASFIGAIFLLALSGVPGLFFARGSMAGQHVSVVLTVLGSVIGLVSVVFSFLGTPQVPHAGDVFFWDPLSCFFLVTIFLLAGLGAIYGLGYWRETEHPENGRKLRFFYGLMVSGMALVVVSRHAVAFLMAWEVMALSAFFLVSTEDGKEETKAAGWVYFVATHISTLLLFGFFAYYGSLRGDLFLAPFEPGMDAGGADILFGLALVAFSLKAGVFPFHVWLPSAHANAPSHVSAILSGVLLKVGVYGLIRVCWMFPTPPSWWGTSVMVLGIISSVLGVVFALGQHDLKRLLAYHSIENIGIIFLGLGLALWGRSFGRVEWVALGMAGALLHVWNHGLFKASLFYAAGGVIHSTHTRSIDALGGLAKKMPWTALGFLVGAVSICGLPPLNGFISEFFVYLGLFKTLAAPEGSLWVYLAVPALALTGALALACFTKVFGVVFLGEPRTENARSGQEPPSTMLFPLFILSGLCAFLGLFPQSVLGVLKAATDCWCPALAPQGVHVLESVPWGVFTLGGALLWCGFLLALYFLRRAVAKDAPRESVPTWDCGYIRPTAAMQYTASSYAETLVDLFKWILVPSRHQKGKEGLFPSGGSYATHVPETVLDRIVTPTWKGVSHFLKRFKQLQLGYLQVYIVYILLTWMILILLR